MAHLLSSDSQLDVIDLLVDTTGALELAGGSLLYDPALIQDNYLISS